MYIQEKRLKEFAASAYGIGMDKRGKRASTIQLIFTLTGTTLTMLHFTQSSEAPTTLWFILTMMWIMGSFNSFMQLTYAWDLHRIGIQAHARRLREQFPDLSLASIRLLTPDSQKFPDDEELLG